MKTIAVIAILIIVAELIWKPRLDRTREGWWLLWYGKHNRNYIKLFKQEPKDE